MERRRTLRSLLAPLAALTLAGTVTGTIAGVLPVGPAGSAVPTASAAPACSVTTSLKLWVYSPEVTCLETRLKALGYSLAGPDKLFGTSTAIAVRSYQKANRLAVDGIVGPITGGALGIRVPLGSSAIPNQGTVAPTVLETRTIGTSVQGRPIVAQRAGTPGGRPILIIGSIHGDEQKGIDVVDELRTMPIPKGIELWTIETINPDGVANNTRQNANEVDLNRNFPQGWSYIPKSTQHRQYSGEAPGDQPETQSTEQFLQTVKPAVIIWYHQDANVISVNGARKEIPKAYGQLVGLGTGNVPCSQLCTGTAGTYANAIPGTTSFLVELPGSAKVTPAMVTMHAEAVMQVIVM